MVETAEGKGNDRRARECFWCIEVAGSMVAGVSRDLCGDQSRTGVHAARDLYRLCPSLGSGTKISGVFTTQDPLVKTSSS